MTASDDSQAEITHVPADLLAGIVDGTSLYEDAEGETRLRAQLDPTRDTLLVFLRHFGCVFCREMVKDVRIASERADASAGDGRRRYPRVVFFHMGDVEEGGRFFGKYWPGACAISDPEKRIYRGMGLARGSVSQLFGPRVLARGLRGMLKGHGIGRPIGDPLIMPGLFLVSPEGEVRFQHAFAHAGDHPRFERFADPDQPLEDAGPPVTGGLAAT